MARKQKFWYVLVFTNNGPKYLTAIHEHKMAEWNELETPLEMNEMQARDIATGLLLNFHSAVAVCSPLQLSHQPYLYEKGYFEFKSIKGKGEEENGK